MPYEMYMFLLAQQNDPDYDKCNLITIVANLLWVGNMTTDMFIIKMLCL